MAGEFRVESSFPREFAANPIDAELSMRVILGLTPCLLKLKVLRLPLHRDHEPIGTPCARSEETYPVTLAGT
jgi:hypothetical protein